MPPAAVPQPDEWEADGWGPEEWEAVAREAVVVKVSVLLEPRETVSGMTLQGERGGPGRLVGASGGTE
ncbi:hypothetical protein GCM10010306_031260 [Streptomyces umbrinus]|nr:hypothetical protein GCM10010306_031260 [Streptomyces umbrinus]GHH36235.1 hypothetical protein GCM10018775_12010 [Streptomyces umbrinus]